MTKKKIIIVSVFLFVLLFVAPFFTAIAMLPWPIAIAVYDYETQMLLVNILELAVVVFAIPLVFYFAHRIIMLIRDNRKTK